MVLDKLRYKIKRINQIVLVLPLWLVLGISYLIKRNDSEKSWSRSQKNENYGTMY